MNLLLDTNILVDYLGRKPPFYGPAQKLFIAACYGDVKLWVPSQSFADAFFVLRKYMDASVLQKVILSALSQVTPVDLTGADLVQAAELSWPDMKDCLVAIAANKAHADYLITRDGKGFERSMVPALTPTAWEQMMEDRGIIYDEIDL